jgi:hypothetical protein
VDLVDEQHVALVELGEDRGEVAGALDRRPAGDVQVHPHLGGDDVRQGRLAQPRWTGEEQVVSGLPTPASGLEHDRQVLLQLALADEVGEQAGSQAALFDLLAIGGDARVEELVTHAVLRAA